MSAKGKQALLIWCKNVTDGYPSVHVTNFHTSWQDGLAFCAIIHHFRPDIIDFSSLERCNRSDNLTLAFNTAEQLGIAPLLDVDDMLCVPKPEMFSVITYLSQYYHFFSKLTPLKRPPPSASPEEPQEPSADTGSQVNEDEPFPLCFECGMELEGSVIEALGRMYHENCFLCSSCKGSIISGGSRQQTSRCLNVDGLPYCDSCGREAFLKNKRKKEMEKSQESSPSFDRQALSVQKEKMFQDVMSLADRHSASYQKEQLDKHRESQGKTPPPLPSKKVPPPLPEKKHKLQQPPALPPKDSPQPPLPKKTPPKTAKQDDLESDTYERVRLSVIEGGEVTTRKDISVADLPNLEGWLEKRGDMGPSVVRSWKKRFFCLRGDRAVYYCDQSAREKDKTDTGVVGYIPLNGVSSGDIEPIQHPKKRGLFNVSTKCPDRVWMLKAMNDDEREEWINAILLHAKWGSGAFSSPYDETTSQENRQLLGKGAVKSGDLMKLRSGALVAITSAIGQKKEEWRSRHFELKDGFLYKTVPQHEDSGLGSTFFSSTKAVKFPLYGCILEEYGASDKDAESTLQFEIRNKRQGWILQAETTEALHDWLNAILKQKIMIEHLIDSIH